MGDAKFTAPDPQPDALRLRATSVTDLSIISACLQDAVVPVGDMRYLREERRFVLVASRFRWERELEDEADAGHERVLCALTFENVEAVRKRGFDPNAAGTFLDLLAVAAAEAEESCIVQITFAGGAAIRLEARELSCHAADLGEPWATPWRPDHG